MLSPFQGGQTRKPERAQLAGGGKARILYRSGKPELVPVDGVSAASGARTDPTHVTATLSDGTTVVVPVAAIAAGAASRTDPRHVDVPLYDGATVSATCRGGGGWLLTDPNVSLADPALRLDGTIAPAP